MRPRNVARVAVFGAVGLTATGAGAEELIVLEGNNLLVRTDSKETPGVVYGELIKGLEEDETVWAIDTLGDLGHLYGLTQRRLYRIDQHTGQATAVGPRFANTPLLTPFTPDLEFIPSTGVGLVV